MPLVKDLRGNTYGYSIQSGAPPAFLNPPQLATSDVEILLRRDSGDTILAS